jgi:acetyl-CoA carboxylase biotin carboxylase subunit
LFKKILIANRGEIAIRVIRACKELGIKTVAVYSTADEKSLHVALADEAICIGPPASKESYLRIPNLISAALISGAEAIHPGYGFLAENAEFSEICKEHGIKFIGPSSSMIKSMGDKALAKETVKKIGTPVVPGSDGPVNDLKEARKIAQEIGFPIMIKAVAGGGGKGMRIVREIDEFNNAFQVARNEAELAFGNMEVYIEKFIENPRHIEIQVMGDQYGNIIHFGERDCAIQRRHQKLIEEAPSPIVDEKLREKMGEAAILAAKSINYEGAGTVEFLVDKDKNFYFIEMNTRIQVEHPVTELVYDVDLVKWQILVAAGEKISLRHSVPKRHAIEFRINAEDYENNFRPSPGKITYLHFPGGPGVRIDSHIYQDYFFPPYYDSLAAKMIIFGENRNEAISRAKRALDEFLIEGIKTTIPLYKIIVDDETYKSGNYDTNYILNLLTKIKR